jgi:hypothetical protein
MRASFLIAVGLMFVVTPVRSQNADPSQSDAEELSPVNDVKPPAAGKDARKSNFGRRSAIPETLSEALAQALESNPELSLAEAKLRQAEAEFYQAKLRTVQDVTIAFHEHQAKRRELEIHRKAKERVPGSTSAHELAKLNDDVVESEAKLAYLLGAGANRATAADGQEWSNLAALRGGLMTTQEAAKASESVRAQVATAAAKRPEIPEKYRKVLQKPIKVQFTSIALMQIIEQFNQLTGNELPILRPAVGGLNGIPVTVDLSEEVPLQTALELVADLTGCVFVCRDYGLLVLPDRVSAAQYPRSATIPDIR